MRGFLERRRPVRRQLALEEPKIVTAKDLGLSDLRDVPRGWRGGTLEQFTHSAKKVIKHGEQGTKRRNAADKVMEKLEEERGKASS